MTWFVFCYWYEPDAPRDPVGLVRIWSLARHLTRLGDSVSVFPPNYRSSQGHQGFRTLAIPLLGLPVLRPLSYAVSSLVVALVAGFRHKPDVVYYRWMESLHPLLLARWWGALCVCEISGEPVPDWSREGAGFKSRLRHWLAGLAIRKADRLVVLTEGLKDLMMARYGAQPARVEVLPSGTDSELFHPKDRADSRRLVGLNPDPEYVGFVGTFFHYQGLGCLLEAMAILKKQRGSVHLLLVGDGEAAEALRGQARRLELDHTVIWTGRVPYAQVPTWIGAMDLCVAPFRGDRGETSPVKVFDYLACGRATVASAIPSVTRVFTENQGVLLVPPDDPQALAAALLHLLNHPGTATDLGRRGREFVEHRYSWGAMVTTLKARIQAGPVASPHANTSLL